MTKEVNTLSLTALFVALGQNGLEKGLISTWKSLGTEGQANRVSSFGYQNL